MSLNQSKLEKIVELSGGIFRARCPACGEGGGDRAGQHLRIYPDGRFGCCIHPNDHDHRRRIFALVGDRTQKTIRIKPASATVEKTPIYSNVFALLKSQGARSITPDKGNEVTLDPINPGANDFGTLGTPFLNSYAMENKNNESDITYKEFANPVPSVPMPYLTPDGTLGIPFDSPERFHWWKGSQSVAKTRAEVESWISTPPRESIS